MPETVLEVHGLTKVFRLRGRRAQAGAGRELVAVDAIDLAIGPGETVALVGQSGSGKTTTGKLVSRLEKPTSGTILLNGTDLGRLSGRDLRRARRSLQMVFQDPYESLDPRYTVGMSVEEPLRALTDMGAAARRRTAEEALDLVDLHPGGSFYSRYPHELSGGQRQRVAIARAIVVRPTFLVADEPVSMLDVSIRAGILELLRRLQAEMGLSMLFITHDLAVAQFMAHRVAVMYRGRIVEHGPAEQVIRSPRHPYTRLLLASVPRVETQRPLGIAAAPAIPDADVSACVFADRCWMAQRICLEQAPQLDEHEPHAAACHFA